MELAYWTRLRQMFDEARTLRGDERARWIERECSDDSDLRGELEALLAHAERIGGFLEPAAATPLERVGEFEIVAEIGHGGMGTVYLARQEHPRRDVALKVIRPFALGPRAVRRFEHEAQVLARLLHPGIAQIYATGTARMFGADAPWFAMELVRGTNLIEFASQKGASIREWVELFTRVCDAVQHAHRRGVIHRDLKPANVLVDASGQPKVLDFGIARTTDSDLRLTTVETDVGAVVGTLPYMSPEQIGGDTQAIDTRSDVYALGVVLYELLTGAMPYELAGVNLAEAARVIREVEPMPPARRLPALRGDLDTIVLKALEKDRARRYGSASELALDLGRWMRDEPIAARPPSTWYSFAKFARRNRGLVAGGVLALAALIAGVVTSTSFGLRAVDAKNEALANLEKVKAEARKREAVNSVLLGIVDSARLEALGREATLPDALGAAEAGLATLARTPDLEAPVRHMLARAWMSLGDAARAREHADRARELFALVPETDEADRLRLDNDEASLLYLEGRIAECAKLAQRVYEAERTAFGELHEDTRNTLGTLARALIDLGRNEEAARRVAELRALAVQAEGEASVAVLRADHYQLTLLEAQDALVREESFVRDAYERAQRTVAADDPLLATIRTTLVLTLTAAGKLGEAAPLAEEAVDEWKRIAGPEHRGTLAALSGWAVVLERLGQLERAEELYRECVDVAQRTLSDHDPFLASFRGLLGVLLFKRGRIAEAEPLLARSVAAHRESNGAGHSDTLIEGFNWASALLQLGRVEDAERVSRETLADAERERPADDVLVLRNSALLGALCVARNKAAEAAVLLARAAEGFERVLGLDDHWTLDTLGWACMAAIALGEYERAETLAEKAWLRQRELYGPDDARTLVSATRVAESRVRLGKLEQGEELVREVLESYASTNAAAGSSWVSAREVLGRALLGRGQLDEAEELLRDSYEQRVALSAPGSNGRREVLRLLIELDLARADAAAEAADRERLRAETVAADR